MPVGPNSETYKGIAALISQEDQQLVVATGTGAISEISATAGTWLVIQDFNISPVPGGSTAITEDDLDRLRAKVLLTMWLRDPRTPVEFKRELLETATFAELIERLKLRLIDRHGEPIREERTARTYGEVFEDRYGTVVEDAAVEKKEQNSVIALTFYSSQGSIVQAPGTTQLGSANDLTSFTTELRPNLVTPISSFFTKTLDNAKGTSPSTGIRKGESSNESKTMTHLMIRARFPTIERERKDQDEGRQLGYFELPITVEPLSVVNLPFLSSSEHPLERLAAFRVGMNFDALQPNKIRKKLHWLEPNVLEGTVSPDVFETATTRYLMNRKIIDDSPGQDAAMGPRYRQRFIVEVRSLLEYDPDFFDSPNIALRNMYQWNSPERIIVALNNSPGRFALERLMLMIDELGEKLVPDHYAERFLARSPKSIGGHHLEYLTEDEVRVLRRDVANHFMRMSEAYGDAFLEAVSLIVGSGTYRSDDDDVLQAGLLRGYHDLVIFDRSGETEVKSAAFNHAHEQFMTLKGGGIPGKLFESSLEDIEDLEPADRAFVIRGTEIVE